jgi:adenylate cyclase
LERRLAAILAADVGGYSGLMGADAAGRLERLKSLRAALVQPKIAARKGRIVKLMGDGLLAEFSSVVGAVQCAADIQHAMAEREADLPDERRIRLRIGVNLGDIIVEGSDIYGDGVNLAARLQEIAEPGAYALPAVSTNRSRGEPTRGSTTWDIESSRTSPSRFASIGSDRSKRRGTGRPVADGPT